jgi:hypothetical protein
MIANDTELEVTLQRIGWFLAQVRNIRKVETDAATYRASAGGFLAEIYRMQRKVREYLSLHPSELKEAG